MSDVAKETNSKIRKAKAFDYRGAAIYGATVIAQGALFALGSRIATLATAPRAKMAPEFTIVGKEDAPIAIRKTATHV